MKTIIIKEKIYTSIKYVLTVSTWGQNSSLELMSLVSPFAVQSNLRAQKLDFSQMKLSWNINSKNAPNILQIPVGIQSRGHIRPSPYSSKHIYNMDSVFLALKIVSHHKAIPIVMNWLAIWS